MWTRRQAIENYNYFSDERVIRGMCKNHSFVKKGSTSSVDMNWAFEQYYEMYVEDADYEDDEVLSEIEAAGSDLSRFLNAEENEIIGDWWSKKMQKAVFLYWLSRKFSEFKPIRKMSLDYFIEKVNDEYEHYGDFNSWPEVNLPTEFKVCPTCNGRGTHTNPSIDCGALTEEDFFDDPEFYDNYINGNYNQTCNQCCGERLVISIANTTSKFQSWLQNRVAELNQFEYDYAQERAAELRMGC